MGRKRLLVIAAVVTVAATGPVFYRGKAALRVTGAGAA